MMLRLYSLLLCQSAYYGYHRNSSPTDLKVRKRYLRIIPQETTLGECHDLRRLSIEAETSRASRLERELAEIRTKLEALEQELQRKGR
jgi:hypothetical protein